MDNLRDKFNYNINNNDGVLEIFEIETYDFFRTWQSMEEILTLIKKDIGPKINNLKIIYKPSNGLQEIILPIWKGDICVEVSYSFIK
jgi:hypothetical protein